LRDLARSPVVERLLQSRVGGLSSSSLFTSDGERLDPFLAAASLTAGGMPFFVFQ
jgi:hypothetical protein